MLFDLHEGCLVPALIPNLMQPLFIYVAEIRGIALGILFQKLGPKSCLPAYF